MKAPFVVRKSLTTCLFSKNSLSLCKSHVPLSHYFSTDMGKQPLYSPTISEFLTREHHFSPEAASRVASVSNRLENLEKADSVLTFLTETGFSNAQLEKTVKGLPSVLSANLEKTIKPKIRIFQDSGFTADEIAEIVSTNPLAFWCSPNRIISSLSVLRDFVGSNVEVAKCLRTSWLLSSNLEKTLVPNVEFLKSCGVAVEQITGLITNDPWFFLLKPENMRKFAEKIDDMGFDRSSRMFIHAVRVVSKMANETWELKLKTFRELGFTEDDILRVFRNAPTVFAVSGKKIKEVTEVLLETGKYDMFCIINTPTVFHYSIEKRYRPRLQVLSVLEKKNLLKKWPRLGTLHLIPDAKFFEKFVAPYLDEVGDVWSAVSGKGAVKLQEL